MIDELEAAPNSNSSLSLENYQQLWETLKGDLKTIAEHYTKFPILKNTGDAYYYSKVADAHQSLTALVSQFEITTFSRLLEQVEKLIELAQQDYSYIYGHHLMTTELESARLKSLPVGLIQEFEKNNAEAIAELKPSSNVQADENDQTDTAAQLVPISETEKDRLIEELKEQLELTKNKLDETMYQLNDLDQTVTNLKKQIGFDHNQAENSFSVTRAATPFWQTDFDKDPNKQKLRRLAMGCLYAKFPIIDELAKNFELMSNSDRKIIHELIFNLLNKVHSTTVSDIILDVFNKNFTNNNLLSCSDIIKQSNISNELKIILGPFSKIKENFMRKDNQIDFETAKIFYQLYSKNYLPIHSDHQKEFENLAKELASKFDNRSIKK